MDVSAGARFDDLASQLRPPLLRLNRRIRTERADTGRTLTQLSALGTVSRFGPLSAGELAAHERVQPPSMTKIIAALEEFGLVQREQHPDDKRQAIIAITAEGAAFLDQSRREGEAWLGAQLAKLDESERQLLLECAPVIDKLASL